MADVRYITVYAADGSLDSSASVTVVDFVDRSSNNRSAPPTISNLGSGEYSVAVSDDDEAVGCLLLLDCGATSNPRYRLLTIHKTDNSNQFFAGYLTDESEALWAGGAPTVTKYASVDGDLTPPAILRPRTYLWCATPTASDVTDDVTLLISAPAGALPAQAQGSTRPVVANVPAVEASTGLSPAQTAVVALRRYLLSKLAEKVVAVNLSRAAYLHTATPGPWTVTSGMALNLGTSSALPQRVALPVGSMSAAQLVSTINTAAVAGIHASVDGYGCVQVAATVAPVAPSTPSSVYLGPDTTGANVLLGWNAGGEQVVNQPLRAPTPQGVCDGYFGANPANGQSFAVVISDRDVQPWPSQSKYLRYDEFAVRVTLEVFAPVVTQNGFRTREHISSVMRALREILATQDGLQLGRATAGDIILTTILSEKVGGRPFSFAEPNGPNVLADVGQMQLMIKVFQLPPTAALN